MEKVLAWHLAPNDGCLGYGDNRKIEVGETLSVEGEIIPYYFGLHGSEKLLDALAYSSGNLLCLTEIFGDLGKAWAKVAGRHRRCLAMKDASEWFSEIALDYQKDISVMEEASGYSPRIGLEDYKKRLKAVENVAYETWCTINIYVKAKTHVPFAYASTHGYNDVTRKMAQDSIILYEKINVELEKEALKFLGGVS